MDLTQAVILALIQGLTEFLPISSSAHLILPFELLGWPDQGLAFDTAIHLGSLVAVVVYFRRDIAALIAAFFHHARSGASSVESRFAINLLIASLPLIPAGLLIKDMVESSLRNVTVIATTTIVFGLLLYVADRIGKRELRDTEMNWRDALIIGVAQCFALVPGTSRSGVTMTAALMLGYSRQAASRISFLISIPAIAGAATLSVADLLAADSAVDWRAMGIGIIVSTLSAYLCITLFLNLINRMGFTPFVVYRLLLGGVLFLFFV